MRQPENDLERDLQQALRRKQPSGDFAARVLARLPGEPKARRTPWFAMPVLRWAAAAVVIVAASSAGYLYRQHEQEQERGRIAKQQLMVALRITGTKLQLAQHRVQQIGAARSAAQAETENQQ